MIYGQTSHKSHYVCIVVYYLLVWQTILASLRHWLSLPVFCHCCMYNSDMLLIEYLLNNDFNSLLGKNICFQEVLMMKHTNIATSRHTWLRYMEKNSLHCMMVIYVLFVLINCIFNYLFFLIYFNVYSTVYFYLFIYIECYNFSKCDLLLKLTHGQLWTQGFDLA